jgi:plastocyanin
VTLSTRQKVGAGALAVAGAVGIGFLVAGGDDDGGDDGGDATTTTLPRLVAGGDRPTETAAGESIPPGTIIALDLQFGPGELAVGAGDTVTFRNEDGVDHTFTADDGLFDSGTLSSGEERTFTFDGPREVGLHCEIHPAMTATLVIGE